MGFDNEVYMKLFLICVTLFAGFQSSFAQTQNKILLERNSISDEQMKDLYHNIVSFLNSRDESTLKAVFKHSKERVVSQLNLVQLNFESKWNKKTKQPLVLSCLQKNVPLDECKSLVLDFNQDFLKEWDYNLQEMSQLVLGVLIEGLFSNQSVVTNSSLTHLTSAELVVLQCSAKEDNQTSVIGLETPSRKIFIK